MNLGINALNVNFQGKKELLYGLNKAAINTRSYSMCMQPRLLRFGENHEARLYKASATAYLDMVTNDPFFGNYIYSCKQKDLQNIKNLLAPEEQNGVKPFDNFRKFLEDIIDKNKSNAAINKKAAKYLLEKLSV